MSNLVMGGGMPAEERAAARRTNLVMGDGMPAEERPAARRTNLVLSGGRLVDRTPLADRSEWLSARDISECFGVSKTTALRLMRAMPHIMVGRQPRVSKRVVVKLLRRKRQLTVEAARELFGDARG